MQHNKSDIQKSFKSLQPLQLKVFVFYLFFVVMNLLAVTKMQTIIDAVVSSHYDSINASLIEFLLIALGLVISIFIYQYYFQLLGQIGSFTLIDFLFEKVLSKNPSEHVNESSGIVSSKILNDSKIISDWRGHGIVIFWGQVIQVILIIAILMYYSVIVTLTILFMLFLCFYFVNIISKKLGEYTGKNQNLTGQVQQQILQALQGIREIKQFKKETYFSKKLNRKLFEEKLPTVKSIGKLQALYFCLAIIMMMILPLISVAIGIILITHGKLTIGALLAIYALVAQLQEPIRTISQSVAAIKQSEIMEGRLTKLIQHHNESASLVNTTKFQSLNIKSQYYEFQGGTKVLKDLNLDIQEGDCVVIKGPSGVGKSTLGNLILRFLPMRGRIQLKYNNQDINAYTYESYYEQVLQSQQKPYVFEGTIQENITIGDNFSEHEINDVLEVTALDDVIGKHGIDFEIKEGGSNLSGGQMQRIGLARALIRKPSLLVLDEPTSALNEDLKKEISKKVQSFAKANRISLVVITHNDEFDKGNRVIELH